MNENKIILKASDIHKSYSTASKAVTQVLKGLSLDIYEGEFAAIMGPSGAGKSTLLHLLGSLDIPDDGKIEIFLNGKIIDYSKLNQAEIAVIRNKNIGFVFQFHHLLPEFTAIENVMLPAFISGVKKSEAYRRAIELLKVVGVEDKAENKPMELSGGEQQRIAIARALINNPQIVLADEPTGNLDSTNAASVLNLIQELKKSYNMTFVVATHSSEVASLAERTLVISDGKII